MLKIRISALMLLATTAETCNIPVFRYALERWKADTCALLVFHEVPLTEQLKTQIGAIADQDQPPKLLRIAPGRKQLP